MDKLIIIAGPTAVGKSAAAVALAKECNGEVISADSMQVYRGMDIGSAKVSAEEMQGIPHHLIDILDPSEPFNVTLFQTLAKDAVKDILSRGKLPILCGGTGFYIQSLLYDIDFEQEEGDRSYRRQLEEISRTQGNHGLYEQLRKLDPASCETIHENNTKRLIRALEFYHENGSPISEHNAKERAKAPAYDARYFVISDRRDTMYERIDKRVDKMLAAGLVEEVRILKDDAGIPRNATSMQGLGYKEIYDYLAGECTLEEAVYTIKRDSRHFAKRQLTWFKREPDAVWLDRSQYEQPETGLLSEMLQRL